MLRFLFWLVMFVLVVVVAVFAVVNRQPVDLNLWPAPYAMTVPAWALAMAGALLGFLAGGLSAWSAGAAARAAGRAHRWRATSLERDLMLEKEKTAKLEKAAQAQAQTPTPGNAAPRAEDAPALPSPDGPR